MIYTSEQILQRGDLYDLAEAGEVAYIPTEGELVWLDFVTNKYAIADYLHAHKTVKDGYVVFNIDAMGLSRAMQSDGHEYKAVCLSDETALQKLVWWLYIDALGDLENVH